MSSGAKQWNGVRFDASRRSDHVESFFFKATAPDAKRAIWLKATIFSSRTDPEYPVAEAWAIAFDHRGSEPFAVAVRQTVPLSRASFGRCELAIDWNDPADGRFHATPGHTSGQVRTGDRQLGWDLRFAGDDRPLVLFPFDWMYCGPFPSSKTVTPYPDVRFQGDVQVGSERWELTDWHGMQGHNWGRGHAELYAWAHCNQWSKDVGLVLEAVSAQVRMGPLLTPVLSMIVVRHDGVDYPFHRLRQLFGTRADIGLRRYTFAARSPTARIEGMLEAPVEQFVGLYYANPRGLTTYCLNSKLATARIRFERQGKVPIELRSEAAALEIGTKRSDHGVRMHV
jgi:hypothetical protein